MNNKFQEAVFREFVFSVECPAEKVPLKNYFAINMKTLLQDTYSSDNILQKKIKSLITTGRKIPDELLNELVTNGMWGGKSEDLIIGHYPRTVQQLEFLTESLSNRELVRFKLYFIEHKAKNLYREQYLKERKPYLEKYETNESVLRNKWANDDILTSQLISKCKEKGIDFKYFIPNKNN